ncbi:MAG: carbamoyltransferase, partial [Deltaproteobacteria bacterium]|nr:carbamoyltransferase [Deltaproteobacteria bacterium]
VLDGIGEDAAGWLGRGAGRDLSVLEEIPYPHSLGLLWERIAIFCGFGEYGAPKVMGLAAYGDPSRFAEPLAEILRVEKGGGAIGHEPWPFVVDNRKAQLRAPTVQALEALLGKARARDDEAVGIEMSPYADVAATLQAQTEEALLATSRRLFAATGEAALVYSGGLALNCVANTRLETEGPFSSLYVPGAAHDAGTALGAAFELARDLGAELETRDVPLTPFLGPAYASREIASSLLQAGLSGEILALGPLVERVVAALMAGELVAWFEGALELGPRALGHRSLLGDPRHLATRERFNTRIKHREVFRPFAASILDREVPRWFEVPQSGLGATMSRDLMILAYPLREEVAARVPAVRHVDGSCRIQAVDPGRQPRYHALIEAFYQATGVPLLLNTSFNDREPIVCTPDDAIRTFLRTGIDALVLEDHFVRRSPERKRVRET